MLDEEFDFWESEIEFHKRAVVECEKRLKSLRKQVQKWEESLSYHTKKIAEVRELQKRFGDKVKKKRG